MKTKAIAPVLLGLLLGTADRLPAEPSDGCHSQDRRAESALLNHRADLSGLVYQPSPGAGWQRLKVPASPIVVLNLWSLRCKPCLEELPYFRSLMAEFPEVPFVFAADPPEEAGRDEIARFWARPIAELAPNRCTSPIGEPPARGSPLSCRIFLPSAPPARSEEARLMRSLGELAVRPITVILDGDRVVRQAYVGSLAARINEIREGIRQLRSLKTARAELTPPRHR